MKRWLVLCAFLLIGAAPASGVTFVQQPDEASKLVGTEVLLQAGLDRQLPTQNGLAALAAQTILETPVESPSGMAPLERAVRSGGGSITYAMEPHGVRFYLEGLAQNYATLSSLFTQALTHPDFSAQTVAAARAKLDTKSADDASLPLTAATEMLNGAFYQNSEAGMPPYGIPETVAQLTPGDVRAFYAAHYRHGDAIVSAVGDLAHAGTNPAAIAEGLPPGVSPAVPVHTKALPSTSRELIARRSVSVPWLVAQYAAPDLRSKDFGAMLILTSFMQRTLADTNEAPGLETDSAVAQGVGALYNFDTTPANVVVYVDGGLGDPARTFSTALTVVNVLGHAKLGGDLQSMKAYAEGRFLESSQTLEDRAWLAGIFASQHMTADYRTAVLQAIAGTTPEELQRVAAHYLTTPTLALVLPRSQSSASNP
jgi:predicted Zn-dependent peptidase